MNAEKCYSKNKTNKKYLINYFSGTTYFNFCYIKIFVANPLFFKVIFRFYYFNYFYYIENDFNN